MSDHMEFMKQARQDMTPGQFGAVLIATAIVTALAYILLKMAGIDFDLLFLLLALMLVSGIALAVTSPKGERIDPGALAEKDGGIERLSARLAELEDGERKKEKQAEAYRLNLFASLSKAEADIVRKIADSPGGMIYVENDNLVVSLMVKKVAYTTSEYGGTVPVMLTDAWQLLMNAHRDEFETARRCIDGGK